MADKHLIVNEGALAHAKPGVASLERFHVRRFDSATLLIWVKSTIRVSIDLAQMACGLLFLGLKNAAKLCAMVNETLGGAGRRLTGL
jgi:hypothetical protein